MGAVSVCHRATAVMTVHAVVPLVVVSKPTRWEKSVMYPCNYNSGFRAMACFIPKYLIS